MSGLLARLQRLALTRPPLLEERLGRGSDNFLLLRHLAAAMVIIGHSHALASDGGADWVARALPGFYAGSFGVCLFFAISGCLVTNSMIRRPRLWRYVKSRFLRVYPAFLCCLLVTVAGFGVAFSNLDAGTYFLAPGTRAYLWHNLDMFGLRYTLPGAFADNTVPGVVNGSLWSLTVEVRMYLVVALLGVLGLLKWRAGFLVLVLGWLAWTGWHWVGHPPGAQSHAALAGLFMLAALAAAFPKWVLLSTRGLILLCGIAWLLRDTVGFVLVAMVAIGYGSLWFALRLPTLKLPGRADFSYGLFLFGFPVQQSTVACLPTLSPIELTAISLPLTLLCAMLSWYLIEKPMLSFKPARRSLRASQA